MLAVHRLFLLCITLLLGGVVGLSFSYAQVFGDAANLVVEPPYPTPNSQVTVSLDAYSMDTTGATIIWLVDGVEQTHSQNERSITLTVGDLGVKKVVSARLILLSGRTINISRNIIPNEVDIVIEASTYTPSFYRGRALPSSGSSVRLIAIPHTVSLQSLTSYTYEWKLNDQALFGGPVKGKYAAEITMSQYEGDYLSVVITDSKGGTVGGKTVAIQPVEPELYFYEENPLRGLTERALSSSFALVGDETTIHGEPYFMATDLSTQSVVFDWKINGNTASPNTSDQHVITLRRTGGEGTAEITLNTLTKTTIPQYVQGFFNIVF